MSDLFVSGGADLSACGTYRYSLWRQWGDGPAVNFVMLNPSTADADKDDPTIRRCIGFAKGWGFERLVVTNLFALRSTDPRVLYRHESPIGPDNDTALFTRAATVSLVVFAWGGHGGARGARVADLLRSFSPGCLGRTKDGSPRHPLYLPKITAVERYL